MKRGSFEVWKSRKCYKMPKFAIKIGADTRAMLSDTVGLIKEHGHVRQHNQPVFFSGFYYRGGFNGQHGPCQLTQPGCVGHGSSVLG